MLLLRPQIPFRLQMVDHGVNVAPCPVLQQTVGADFVQPKLLHPLVPAAPQNVPQQIRAHIVAKGVVYPLHTGEMICASRVMSTDWKFPLQLPQLPHIAGCFCPK